MAGARVGAPRRRNRPESHGGRIDALAPWVASAVYGDPSLTATLFWCGPLSIATGFLIAVEGMLQGLHLFQKAKRRVVGDNQPVFVDEEIPDVDTVLFLRPTESSTTSRQRYLTFADWVRQPGTGTPITFSARSTRMATGRRFGSRATVSTLGPGSPPHSSMAVSIIDRAMRSLIDPPGFWLSSFTNSRHGPVSKRVISTTGVSPIRPSTPGRGGADI